MLEEIVASIVTRKNNHSTFVFLYEYCKLMWPAPYPSQLEGKSPAVILHFSPQISKPFKKALPEAKLIPNSKGAPALACDSSSTLTYI